MSNPTLSKEDKIYIAGHRGMVGSAICRKLSAQGYNNQLHYTSKELDLRNQSVVNDMMSASLNSLTHDLIFSNEKGNLILTLSLSKGCGSLTSVVQGNTV